MKKQNCLTTLLLKLKHNLHAILVNRASYVCALTPVERVLGHPSPLHSLFQCRHATLLPRFWGLEGAFRDDLKNGIGGGGAGAEGGEREEKVFLLFSFGDFGPVKEPKSLI